MKFKQLLIGFMLGAVLFSTISIFATNYIVNPNPFPILVNGENKEVEALNVNNSTYLKLSDVGSALGTRVAFNSEKKLIEIGNTKSIESESEPNSNLWIRAKDYSKINSIVANSLTKQLIDSRNSSTSLYTLYYENKPIKAQIYDNKSYFNIEDLKTAGLYTE